MWVDKVESIELSFDDILKITNTRIVPFVKLNLINDLLQLFTNNSLIIYYETESSIEGHYSTLIYFPVDNMIHHFDSYGMGIDKLYAISDYTKKHTRSNYLRELITNTCDLHGLIFTENKKQYQQYGPVVSTCGRYASVRCKLAGYNPAQFNAFLLEPAIDTDKLVSLLTVLFN
jgi:hypothetical protein